MSNKVVIKKFLGMDVRVINEEYLILKDMFNALGRVKDDGTWTNEKKKTLELLKDINKLCDHQELVVTCKTKKSKSRENQKFDCLKLNTVPILLTQFKPTNSNRRTKEENEEALNIWRQFMVFVDNLLSSLEVYKYIIIDKENQKTHVQIVEDNGGKAMITNQQVNIIMAKLIGVYEQGIKRIKKDELKTYQSQTTIDLLEAREFVLSKFANAFEFTGSHKQSAKMAEDLARKKYNLNE